MSWQSSDTAALRRLWSTGMSSTKIAETLGRSRRTIIQKAKRLHLPRRTS